MVIIMVIMSFKYITHRLAKNKFKKCIRVYDYIVLYTNK